DPKAASYESLFKKIQSTGADAVFLGGLIDENGAQVIKDKVAVLGPNDGNVKLFVPDGFTTLQTIDGAPGAAPGMFLSVAGVPIDQFKGKGAEFIEAFKPRPGGKPVAPYAIYGAQAAQVMLNAIAASDGSRGDVIAKLFEQKINDGYLGTFEINENGDPGGAEGAVVGFTISKATTKLERVTTISPKRGVVGAARGWRGAASTTKVGGGPLLSPDFPLGSSPHGGTGPDEHARPLAEVGRDPAHRLFSPRSPLT